MRNCIICFLLLCFSVGSYAQQLAITDSISYAYWVKGEWDKLNQMAKKTPNHSVGAYVSARFADAAFYTNNKSQARKWYLNAYRYNTADAYLQQQLALSNYKLGFNLAGVATDSNYNSMISNLGTKTELGINNANTNSIIGSIYTSALGVSAIINKKSYISLDLIGLVQPKYYYGYLTNNNTYAIDSSINYENRQLQVRGGLIHQINQKWAFGASIQPIVVSNRSINSSILGLNLFAHYYSNRAKYTLGLDYALNNANGLYQINCGFQMNASKNIGINFTQLFQYLGNTVKPVSKIEIADKITKNTSIDIWAVSSSNAFSQWYNGGLVFNRVDVSNYRFGTRIMYYGFKNIHLGIVYQNEHLKQNITGMPYQFNYISFQINHNINL